MISTFLFSQARVVAGEAADGSGIKNVLFIVLDALRADHLGIYGYDRNTSPNIDRLARNGIVFDRAIVQAGWTKPSMASYLTSTSPAVHQVLLKEDVLPENLATMAEIFKENGYFTCGFVNNPHLDSLFGFGKGFDIYARGSDDQLLDYASRILTGRYMDTELIDNDELLRIIEEYNLVPNNGFEKGFDGWRGREDWLTADEAHSGLSASRISHETISDTNFYLLGRPVRLKHGTEYVFGAFIKTKDLKDEISVEVKEGKGAGAVRYKCTKAISGDNDWTLLWQVFKPRIFDAVTNEVELVIRAGRAKNFTGGEFWVDDVFIFPIDALSSFRPEKLFIYLHLFDPHAPYDPPELYLSCFKNDGTGSPFDGYDAEIKATDNKLEVLFDGLEALGVLEETLVILTSDHGETFGEHGRWRHDAKYFYDEVGRVPLILSNPVLFTEPGRVEESVEAIDLLPSLVEILNLKLPPGVKLQGKPFFRTDKPRPSYAYLYECPYLKSQAGGGAYVKAVSDSKWKYVSNEYFGFRDGVEVRGAYRGEEGTEITVLSPQGKKAVRCRNEKELSDSDFFKSFAPELQSEILRVYRDADRQEAMLFNIREDPEEKKNVIDYYPAQVNRFRRLINERITADRDFFEQVKVVPGGKAGITDELEKQLRSRGYLN